ncbi:MAG: hypothetical protein HQL07_17860 [Nitrospirae bacterium]|nr:hypothetical protein [Magnetococcales bacterium]
MRIIEPVWPVVPVPPSQKQAEEPLHTHKKAEKLFLTIFQEVADRCRPSGGRQSPSRRLPFLGGRKPRNRQG